jgi:hypothetical protein
MTYWMSSSPLTVGSFFGLDFMAPVRLRSISVDVGHTFQKTLILEVLHALTDRWYPLHTKPQLTLLDSPELSGRGSNSGAPADAGSGSDSGSKTPLRMRFTYSLERELRDLWRLQVRLLVYLCGTFSLCTRVVLSCILLCRLSSDAGDLLHFA